MHLDAAWRARLFTQIDLLHEPDDWDESYKLTDLESFKTFLHLILQQGPWRGWASASMTMATYWRVGGTIKTCSHQFLGHGQSSPGGRSHQDGEVESAGGQTNLDRLPTVLQAYNPESQYGNANNLPSS